MRKEASNDLREMNTSSEGHGTQGNLPRKEWIEDYTGPTRDYIRDFDPSYQLKTSFHLNETPRKSYFEAFDNTDTDYESDSEFSESSYFDELDGYNFEPCLEQQGYNNWPKVGTLLVDNDVVIVPEVTKKMGFLSFIMNKVHQREKGVELRKQRTLVTEEDADDWNLVSKKFLYKDVLKNSLTL
eukprot:snap_masked-scaffold_7-processed-gene-2.30-mRNA-1 protein AED:1.00 eAED:1.00 QI:0/-1/0/0/-1/1/1/0/183